MANVALLNDEEIAASLHTIPEWQLANGEISRTYAFENFRDAMSFVNLVAALAEQACHHPDIDIRYNKVDTTLVSHDAGGLTGHDFTLALQIDQLL